MTSQPTISLVEVTVPDLGDIHDVPVIEVLARVGERVAVDQTLVVFETEKATMDVPSTAAGVIREVMVKVGDKISCGSLLVMLEPMEAAVRHAEKAVATAPLSTRAASGAVAHAIPAAIERRAVSQPLLELAELPAGSLPHASPSVRRFAREFGLDVTRVHGSGPKGRILHIDLQVFVKTAVARPAASTAATNLSAGFDLLPWPEIDFARCGCLLHRMTTRVWWTRRERCADQCALALFDYWRRRDWA